MARASLAAPLNVADDREAVAQELDRLVDGVLAPPPSLLARPQVARVGVDVVDPPVEEPPLLVRR